MSLPLPAETLLLIQSFLPPFLPTERRWPPRDPLVQTDPCLRSLSATNRQLRMFFYPSLYSTVVINLEREELDLRCALLMSSFLADAKVLKLVK